MSKKKKPRTDIKGKKFGRLTAMVYVPDYGEPKLNWLGKMFRPGMWKCICDCGNTFMTFTNRLTSGKTKSCGCLQPSAAKKAKTVHGESPWKNPTPEYKAFCGAKSRCTNKNNPAYYRYGGRGIEFRFKDVAELISCVGRKPSSKHSLDRINNNGHYEPGNVRWATDVEQARNRGPRVLRVFVNCPHCNGKVYGVRPTAPGVTPQATPNS